MDDKLTWKPHIKSLCTKLARFIGIIGRLNRILTKKTLLQLYNSFIYCHLSYCNIVWGSTYPSTLKRLEILQKKAVRRIYKTDYLAHTAPLFKDAKILKLKDINLQQMSQFMYRYVNKELPDVFNNFFRSINTRHNTRSKNNFYPEPYKSNLKRFSVKIKGPITWNNLDNGIKCSPSINSFKYRIKDKLLSSY